MALTCDYLLSILGHETLLTETMVSPRQWMNSPELWAWSVSDEAVNKRPAAAPRMDHRTLTPRDHEKERADNGARH
jgi:hypothetical protein